MRLFVFALVMALFAMAAPPLPHEICKSRCESDFRLCQKRAANAEGRKICKAMRKSCDRGCPPKQ